MRGSPIARLLINTYLNKQFVLYVLCGLASSLVHLMARWVLNYHMGFSAAVFISYFIGMPVAFILYRTLVFNIRGGAPSREMILFALTYFGFLPITWTLSVLAEAPLLSVFKSEQARLLAHLVGITVPMLLNFAYNKFVTFRKEGTGWI